MSEIYPLINRDGKKVSIVLTSKEYTRVVYPILHGIYEERPFEEIKKEVHRRTKFDGIESKKVLDHLIHKHFVNVNADSLKITEKGKEHMKSLEEQLKKK